MAPVYGQTIIEHGARGLHGWMAEHGERYGWHRVYTDAALRDMLTDLGYSVVGPVGARTTAIAAARQADIEGAVLDLNLRGETTYLVADELNARGIPFIFLTGYDRGVIDRRYAGAPLLQKPVDEQTLQRALAAFLDSGNRAPPADVVMEAAPAQAALAR